MSEDQHTPHEDSATSGSKPEHHTKKYWKEYLLEFLMIFLAVTLGFFAESYRENLSDKAKEKKYIKSIIADLEQDKVNLQAAIKEGHQQFNGIETLVDLLGQDQWTQSELSQLYQLNTANALTITTNWINDMTMRQLLSSGDMRLIEEQQVADTIMQYYGLAKDNYDRQASFYGKIMERVFFSSSDLFSFKYGQFKLERDSTFSIEPSKVEKEFKLITTDKATIEKYSEQLLTARGLNVFYINHLQGMRQRATALSDFLKKYYHLS